MTGASRIRPRSSASSIATIPGNKQAVLHPVRPLHADHQPSCRAGMKPSWAKRRKRPKTMAPMGTNARRRMADDTGCGGYTCLRCRPIGSNRPCGCPAYRPGDQRHHRPRESWHMHQDDSSVWSDLFISCQSGRAAQKGVSACQNVVWRRSHSR
jgi:hypothetical protein